MNAAMRLQKQAFVLSGAAMSTMTAQSAARILPVLRRCFAGGYGITVDPYVADANKDAAVNGKDITLLRRYLAGGYNISLE